jgi:hypothetical protein
VLSFRNRETAVTLSTGPEDKLECASQGY